MIDKDKLLTRPNYLLTRYQNEIYRQLFEYKEKHNLTQGDLAKKLGVSDAYVSQVLRGNFNFTLKKLIELGLLIGKVPLLEFIDKEEYWINRKDRNSIRKRMSFTLDFVVQQVILHEDQLKKVREITSASAIAKSASIVVDCSKLDVPLS